MENIFAGVKDAKVSERGSYCNPGLYTIQIKKILSKRTRKNLDAFIVEFTILTSNHDEEKKKAVAAFNGQPFDMSTLEKKLPNKAGTTASWFQSLADREIGFGALKGFAASITGANPESKDFNEGVEMLLSAAVKENILDGYTCPLETVEIQTKKNTPFTIYKWGVGTPPSAASAVTA